MLNRSIDFYKIYVHFNEFFSILLYFQTMQDQLKLSADPDMQDWFLDRDSKIPQVILNDKLMTDAIIGSLPIKTEHSYSLNSDGDSVPESPNSLNNKMDGKLSFVSTNAKF